LVSKNDLKHFSLISRLELTEKEIDRFQSQIRDTLKYIDVLENIETESLEMDIQQMEYSALREDIVVPFLIDVFSGSVVTPEGFVKAPKLK
jgi:aspartyl/glutamyl-tRNA(Asn/Gln) amidotransferase C subunit